MSEENDLMQLLSAANKVIDGVEKKFANIDEQYDIEKAKEIKDTLEEIKKKAAEANGLANEMAQAANRKR